MKITKLPNNFLKTFWPNTKDSNTRIDTQITEWGLNFYGLSMGGNRTPYIPPLAIVSLSASFRTLRPYLLCYLHFVTEL